ncbi:acyl-CoA dehydrogenase [Kineobactrum sediminis]|uniref:Acyl-CoA dehydrogenase n=2 Tax=Kineobactrum sediminis TaxID=1905677 RepID=A0A2N5XYH6_9GAMM|nr:acyl-CoA dehydrogenase [Kineobactrum sediminis]
MILDVAREFCRDQSDITAVRAQLESPDGFDPGVWQQMVALGWAGIALPERVGGAGLGMAAVVPVLESMGRALLGGPLMSTALAGQLVLRAAGEEQDELLSAIAAGQPATIAWLDNHDWGSAGIQCELDANGVLQGRKQQVMDAAGAEWFLVVAQQAGEPVLAVLPASAVAADARRDCILIDQTRRAQTIDFTGIAVASTAVLKGPQVAAALRDVRLLGALLVAAESGGSAASCLDTTVDYLKTRKQFGKLIGSYQALKHPCVDILVAVDSTRSFVYHAASLLDDGPLSRDAEIGCRMAKAQATETLKYAGDRAIQFHGGMGFTYECDAQLYVRRAQWAQQQFGDAQHQRKQLAHLLLDA